MRNFRLQNLGLSTHKLISAASDGISVYAIYIRVMNQLKYDLHSNMFSWKWSTQHSIILVFTFTYCMVAWCLMLSSVCCCTPVHWQFPLQFAPSMPVQQDFVSHWKAITHYFVNCKGRYNTIFNCWLALKLSVNFISQLALKLSVNLIHNRLDKFVIIFYHTSPFIYPW